MTRQSAPAEIRPFQPGDLVRLQEIRAAAFAPIFRSFRSLVGDKIAAHAFTDAESEQAAFLSGLCATESEDHVIVASTGDLLVGFCAYRCDQKSSVGEITLNAVDPKAQNRGVGGLLFDYAIEAMRAQGMRVATVGTGGDDSHAAARRAYEKVGFNRTLPNVYYYRAL